MRIIPTILVVAALFFVHGLHAQNCGCADQGNCEFSYGPNSTTQVCYDITDAFNNNLANPNQGVCGVYIKFRQGVIGALELTLTAPDGTEVQLAGSNSNCNCATPVAIWDILFVADPADCDPDTTANCPLPCVFNTCPSTCIPACWPNGYFTGSYLPFNGSLTDFDSGPANGQWCIEITNDAQFNGGKIFDFEVILCDQSGILCCDADAGSVSYPDFDACEGDSSLLLTPAPGYGSIVPDPLKYGYTFAIFENNSTLLGYDTMPDLRSYTAGTYHVCGLSYLYADTLDMPAPGTAWTPLTLNDTLTGANPPFCGDIRTNCIDITISAPPPAVNLADTVCVGDSVTIGDSVFVASGTYTVLLESFGGCDSIVNLNLTMLPVDSAELQATLCPGEAYIIENDTFSTTGIHSVVLQNNFGCDSIIILDLTILDPADTMLAAMICLGDTAWIGTKPFTMTGIYKDTLTSSYGCDSIVTMDLSVVEVTVSIPEPDTLTCLQTVVNLQSNATTNYGTLNYLWSTNATSPGISMMQPDTFSVVVSAAGCNATDTVEVFQNAEDPVAIILNAPDDTLTCSLTSIQLDGSTSSTANGLMELQWSTLSGTPVPTPSAENIEVSTPDTWQLMVTDPVNGCTNMASILIVQDTTPPVAEAGPGATLSCFMPEQTLDGSNSSPTGNISFAWSTVNGHFMPPADLTNPVINVDEEGMYYLTVTNLFNDCQHIDSVLIEPDTVGPHITMTLPDGDQLTCVVEEVTLNASTSTTNPNVVVQWTGNVTQGPNPLIVTVSEPGPYTLTMTDAVNGCSDMETVVISIDTIPPFADAGPDDTLDCTSPQNIGIVLGGAGTSIGPEFSYDWTHSPGGNFTTITDSSYTKANKEATYYLNVTSLDNGCTAIDSMSLINNADFPNANAGPDRVLNCQDTAFALIAETNPVIKKYTWSTLAGVVIVSGPDDSLIVVNTPGTYILTIDNALCFNSDTVVVTQNSVLPLVDAGPDAILDCSTGQATLNGIGSDNGTGFSLQWTSSTGHFVSGENTLTPVVDEPGDYVLQIRNDSTFCTAFDTIQVLLDTAGCMPLVDAGADGFINCYNINSGDTLQASGSVGPNFSYQWVALSGTIKNVADPFAPVVTLGEYVFSITNTAVDLIASDTVLVLYDTIRPYFDLGGPTILLDCPSIADCYQIDVSSVPTGPEFSYYWEPGSGGALCTPPDVLNAGILGSESYTLIVTNTLNGCSASSGIFIELDGSVPVSNAGPDIEMDCGETLAFPVGTGSTTGPDITYEWFSFGGNVQADSNTLLPTVSPNNLADTFHLVVFNTHNLCRDTSEMVVFAPQNCAPDSCMAVASGQLDCDTDTVSLTGTGSSTGSDITYQWSTFNGMLCGGETTLDACASGPGIYNLTVIKTYPNNSIFIKECNVQVFENIQPPAASAGPDRNLTCKDTVLTLNGSASSTGTDFTYLWTTAAGHIISGETTQTPLVDEVGTYSLQVTNTSNGCTATDNMTVGLDTLHPVAEAGPGFLLTCNDGDAVLQGSGTPLSVSYQWATTDGDISTGTNTPTPTVTDAGTYVLTVTIPANGCTDSDFTIVTKDSSVPDPDAGPDLYYTCTDTVFTLNATANGGALLTYEWTASNGGCIIGPADVLQPTVACPGNYLLTVTDQTNACSAESQMEVIDFSTPPVADAGSTQEINCNQLVVTLDGSGSTQSDSLDFFWSTIGGHFVGGETTAMPQVDSAGVYQVLVVNQFTFCRDTASVVVTIDANIPVVTAGPDSTLTCIRDSLKLNGTGSSTGTGIVYTWTTSGGYIISGANTLTPLINQPGTYTLTVEDLTSQCIVMDSAVVTMDTIPPTAIIDLSQNLTLTCDLPQVTLHAGLSTPADSLSWHWETQNGHILLGINAVNATVDSIGLYQLSVTNTRNGCTDTTSVTVDENVEKPAIQFAPAAELNCAVTEVQLEVFPPGPGPDYTYLWSGPMPIAGPGTMTPTVSQVGIYQVTITDTSNGCESDSVIVVAGNFIQPDAVASAQGALDCETLVVQVSGEGSSENNVSYQWTTNGIGSIDNPAALATSVDAAGWYYLTVTRLDNGCEATDSTEVTINALPIDNALISLNHPDCVDPEGYITIDSVFGGSAPYFFSLNDDIFITYPVFSYLDPGSYNLTIEDQNGCSWSTSVLLLEPGEVLVELGDDITIRQGESAELQAQLNIPMNQVDNIQWQNLPDSTECPQCLEQTVSPEGTTVYRIEVIDTNGCSALDKITVYVNEERPFYVPTAFSPNEDGINDRLLLYAGPDVALVHAFRIFDRWGNLVFQARDFEPNDPAAGWDGNFEGQTMNPAVFVWMAEVEFLDGDRGVFYGDVTLVR